MKPLTLTRILVEKKTQGQLTFVEVGWSARTILTRKTKTVTENWRLCASVPSFKTSI